MNHIYRLVWNDHVKTFIVAAETASARGKRSGEKTGGKGSAQASAGKVKTTVGQFRLRLLALLLAAQFSPALVSAHTISIGYENSGDNALTFWYGTYHTGVNYNEGSMNLTGPNGFNVTSPYNLLVSTKPGGLVDGATNFYSGGTATTLQATDTYGSPVDYWQGIQFTNLAPGTYTFTYVPITNPTQVWAPINPAILSNSVTVITADLNNSALRIGPGLTEGETNLSPTDPIIFTGGTVLANQDDNLSQVVSVSDGGGTFDTNGHNLTLTGNMDGRGVLTKTGDGTLFLRGTNTSVGGTLLQGGILNIDNDARLGAPSAGVTFDGGTLQLGSSFDLSTTRALTFNAGGGTIDTNGFDSTLSQNLTGAGSLTKVGDGTLMLDGNNSGLTGGVHVNGGVLSGNNGNAFGNGNIELNGGTLRSDNDFHLANAFMVSSDSTVDTQDHQLDLDGNLSGGGKLTKNGTGTLGLHGDDSNFTGGILVNGGKVTADDGNSLGSGTVELHGGTLQAEHSYSFGNALNITADSDIDTQGNNVTHIGTISGDHVLSKDGSGDLKLTGDNSGFTGGFKVNGGNLAVDNGNELGAGNLELHGGSLRADGNLNAGNNLLISADSGIDTQGNQVNLSGTLAGTGKLTKSGSGTLALSGDNSGFSGGINVTSGTLSANNENALGSGGVQLSNATLLAAGDINASNNLTTTGASTVDTGSHAVTLSGTVSGTGGLDKNGTGTLNLTGTNSFSGGLNINAGTVAADSDGALGTGNLTLNGGTLQATGDLASSKNVSVASDSGIDTQAGAVALSGDLSGTGNLSKAGNGTLALSGNNVGLTGNINVNGGKLSANGAAALGSGQLSLADGTTLQTTGDLSAANNVTLSGAGTVDTGSQSVTLSGTISGSGSLDKNGTGTLALTGNNTFTGGLDINTGTVAANGATALGAGSIGLNGGTLQAQTSFDVSNNMGVSNSSVIDTKDQVLGMSGDFTGTQIITKIGTGTLALSGDNSGFSGGWRVNQGNLTVSSATALGTGTVGLNGTTLQTNVDLTAANQVALTDASVINTGTNNVTLSGPVTGSGSLTKTGLGTLTLSGNNTFSGGVNLNAGMVAADSAASVGSGDILLNGGTLRANSTFSIINNVYVNADSGIDTQANDLTLNGTFSGSGALTKMGSGTLILAGDNHDYTGVITVAGGMVDVANGTSVGSGQMNFAGGTLHTTASTTISNPIAWQSGGQINTDANTTLTLTGGITDTAGGSSCFLKTGGGRLITTGAVSNNIGGCVEQGTLSLNGTFDGGPMQVYTNGTLGGAGVINAPVYVSGHLAPGNSPGTLTVNNNVVMSSGSALDIDIDGYGTGNGAGNHDRVVVTGAGNTFNAAGSVNFKLRGITGSANNNFTPQVGDTFTFVQSEGGVNGRFDTVNQPTAGLAPNTELDVFYFPNTIVARTAIANYGIFMKQAGLNANAQAAAGVLDSVKAIADGSRTPAQESMLYDVAGLRADQIVSAAGKMAGDIHPGVRVASWTNASLTADSTFRHLQDLGVAGNGYASSSGNSIEGKTGTVTPQQNNPEDFLWVDVGNNHSHLNGDNQAASLNLEHNYLMVGADLLRSKDAVAGVAFGRTTANLDTGSGGSGSATSYQFLGYGSRPVGSAMLDGVVSVGSLNANTSRSISELNSGLLSSSSSGYLLSASGKIYKNLDKGSYLLQPFARLSMFQQKLGDTAESGNPLYAEQINGSRLNGGQAMLGLSSVTGDGSPDKPLFKVTVAAVQDLGDWGRESVSAQLNGQSLEIQAPNPSRFGVRADLQGTVAVRKDTNVFASIATEYHSGRSDYAVRLGVNKSF